VETALGEHVSKKEEFKKILSTQKDLLKTVGFE
jgi:hypothetical protein